MMTLQQILISTLFIGYVTTASALLQNKTYDFVVIGGGTAGLVVANRLSETPSAHILVIETGNSALDVKPSVFYTLFTAPQSIQAFVHNYSSVPQISAGGEVQNLPVGVGIGGSSLINSMVYTRAEDHQIDAWEEAGNVGWNWENLYPYYKKSERLVTPALEEVERGASFVPGFHGFQGPVTTGWPVEGKATNIFSELRESFEELNVSFKKDLGGGHMRGFGSYPSTLTPGNESHPDVRADSGRSYYYPYQTRSNLHMMTETTALRLLWDFREDSDQVSANGVEVVTADGQHMIINVTQEVVVSCGSYGSPPLLERSGIGNKRVLSKYNIDMVVHLPGVGENLMDQICNTLVFTPKEGKSYADSSASVAYLAIDDLYSGNASFFSNASFAALPSYADTISAQNDNATCAKDMLRLLQIQHALLFEKQSPGMEYLCGGFGARAVGSQLWPTMPFSRGSIHIQSSDPEVPPTIDSKFFQLGIDSQLQVQAARYIRKLFTDTQALRDIVVSEVQPGLDVVPEDADDETWLAWIKKSYRSSYHPVGTNIMLPREIGGVTSPRCKVYGTKNVRVVDASIFTFQTNGHTSSNVYAVAERCSDLIREDIASGI